MNETNKKYSREIVVTSVMIFTFLGKILGFFKELILAYYYGAGDISDAYLISQTIPGTLFLIIGTGVATCYVPTYIAIKRSSGKNSSELFTNKFITVVVCISLVLTLLLEIAPGRFVKLFAIGFNENAFSLAVSFTRINGISLVLSGLLYCFSGLLQAEKKYQYVAISNIPYNIGLVVAIVIGAYTSVNCLAFVSVLAVALQLGFLWLFVRKIPYYYKPSFAFKDENLKKTLTFLPSVLLGVAATEINTLIDRTLASTIIAGGITLISYGTSLFNLVIGVFSHSVSSIYYPLISEASLSNNKQKFNRTVDSAIYTAIYFLLPCTIGIIILREPIVKMLFGHGEFGLSHVNTLSSVLACYSLGFVPFALKQILNNVYYSFGRTTKPMINTVVSVLINIVLNVILSYFIGISGLALATSISAVLVAILLVRDYVKDFDGGIISEKIHKIIVLAICSFIMGMVCYFLNIRLENSFLLIIIKIGLSAIVYVGLSCILKVCPISAKMY